MIPLHRTPYENREQEYLMSAMELRTGQTSFCALCEEWMKKYSGRNVRMTSSCSTALDMAAVLLKGKPGDEVILPSFTFASTANAFIRQGMIPVFADIRPDTMNLDEKKIEAAITEKTTAIVPMHYAGVACEMDTVLAIAKEHRLAVIEDAAQAAYAFYKGKPLGSLGDFGCISFHETKNFSMGEGGALLVKEDTTFERAEIYAECGTSRSRMRRGLADSYTWMDAGASCLPSELACTFLYSQLFSAAEMTKDRLATWDFYNEALQVWEERERIRLPKVPEGCAHNAHIFYLRTENKETRDSLLAYLRENGIMAAFHYIPLHSSPAGKKYGRFHGNDEFTTKESECLLRLPLYYGMKEEEKQQVAETVIAWLKKKGR